MNYYFRRKVARVWHFSMTKLRMSTSLMIRSTRIHSMSQRIRTKIFRCLNTKMNFQIQVHYLDKCIFILSYMYEWSGCVLRLVLFTPPPPHSLRCRQRKTSKLLNGHWIGSAIKMHLVLELIADTLQHPNLKFSLEEH